MKIFTLLCMVCLFSTVAKSQKVTLDLSRGGGDTLTIDPMKISNIELVNRLVGNDYKYTYKIEKNQLPAPSLPSFSSLAGSTSNNCSALVTAINSLNRQHDEKEIPKNIKDLQSEINRVDKATCSADITNAAQSIYLTRQLIPLPFPVTVNRGEIIKIKINRDDKTWIFVFKTEQVNHWKVYFGFTYVPDFISKFDNYYAKSDTGSTALVSKMNNDNKKVLRNISPTVLFTYRFYDKETAPLKFGLTGGFMYNLETLGAMAGPSVVIGDNISLTVGISTIQKDRLLGQYAEGQRLKETLIFSQLHEKVWTYDMFFSLGFNIPELFNKSSEKSKKPAE